MAEWSGLWTTGGAGDGANSYTSVDWSTILKALAHGGGVVANYLNDLAGTVTGANTASINTGGAIVDGKPYNNSAPVAVNVPSAVGAGNTRIDRIVLRANWTAQTVRITRIAGTDALTPAAPAITQTSGTTYDVALYQALVDTSGTVALTDERAWIPTVRDGEVDTDQLALGAVDTDQLADAAVTPAKVANRTRSLTVVPIEATGRDGAGIPDGQTNTVASGIFVVPADMAVGTTIRITPLVAAIITKTGVPLTTLHYNLYDEDEAAAVSDDSSANTVSLSPSSNSLVRLDSYVDVAGAAPGNVINFYLSRDGAAAGDTYADNVWIVAFIVEYTADS